MAEFSIWVAGFGDIKLWHAQFWSKSYFYWRNEHEYSRKVNPRLKVGLSKFKGLKARPRIPQSGPRIPQSGSRIPQSGPRVPQSVLGVVTYAFRFGFRFLYLQEPEIWRWANMGGWMRLQLCLWWWTPRPLQMYRQVSSQTPHILPSPLTVSTGIFIPLTMLLLQSPFIDGLVDSKICEINDNCVLFLYLPVHHLSIDLLIFLFFL